MMESSEAKWQPLPPAQRRIVGVLIEKAKTTPDQYPLSLKGLTTGCNQKSNRAPVMNLDSEDVEVDLDELRALGAVVEVQSGGRVAKFKHLMYEWLGVDKVELAVVAELLLRGEQTVGDLRSRAARMEPIADQAALREVLRGLVEKKLVVELTPEGRGQLVTHGLLPANELATARDRAQRAGSVPSPPPRPAAQPPARDNALQAQVSDLQKAVETLTERLERLETRVSGGHEDVESESQSSE